MTSPSPLCYDTYYHIFNRGNNRENIFIQERNYHYFFKLYTKYIEPVAETFAYCLLRNHFHLLVRIKPEDEITDIRNADRPLRDNYPSRQFSDFFNAYSKGINAAYGRTGSLFQHPFGRIVITNDRQFWNIIAYIHQNPKKHKFVTDFRDWKWSSYGVILTEKPTKLNRNQVLDWFGGVEQYLLLHTTLNSEEGSQWFADDDLD